MGKAVGKGDAAKVKAWLKGHGHAAERVDRIKAGSGAELRRGVLEVHGVSVGVAHFCGARQLVYRM